MNFGFQVSFSSKFIPRFVNKEAELPSKDKKFIRKGIVGDSKNYFTPEMDAEWDPWIESQLKGTGLTF